jgi:hypothetical protein
MYALPLSPYRAPKDRVAISARRDSLRARKHSMLAGCETRKGFIEPFLLSLVADSATHDYKKSVP